jgi:hypothetical protein
MTSILFAFEKSTKWMRTPDNSTDLSQTFQALSQLFPPRILSTDDESVLGNVAPGVFDHAVDPRWTAEFLADSRHHLAVALDGDIHSIQFCKNPAIKNFLACRIA